MSSSFSYRPRIADSMLKDRLQIMGAVVIEGVKSCGKTETARQVAKSELLVDLKPDVDTLLEVNPSVVLSGEEPRLLDEWQRSRYMWDHVRREVDARRKPGQFILTGSATPNDNVRRHAGSGRFGIIKMRTLTLWEKGLSSGDVSIKQLLEGESEADGRCNLTFSDYLNEIVIGGWPQLIGSSEKKAKLFLNDYINTLVEVDVYEQAYMKRDPQLLRRFLYAYAQLTCHTAGISAIINRADPLARNTAASYIDALKRLMIIDEINGWNPSLRSRQRLTATPKRILADPSLAACLLNSSAKRLSSDLETTGFLFEALVAHNIRIYAEANDIECYHYREHSGRLEVDYILETNDGEWVGFEVKLGSASLDDAASSLLKLKERVPKNPKALVIVTPSEYAYKRKDGVFVVPLGCLSP